jgi:hypothetical protein
MSWKLVLSDDRDPESGLSRSEAPRRFWPQKHADLPNMQIRFTKHLR